MSTALSSIYKSKAFVLARTSVIKLNGVALMINDGLRAKGYHVDNDDPTTWKYYLNLNGEYHQADHDLLKQLSNGESSYIQVLVASDQGSVSADFTKDLIHGDTGDIAVGNEYRFNTNYYNELVTRYPDFEYLILGILNPIESAITIPAEDGEILYCGGYVKTRVVLGKPIFIRTDYGPLTENFLIESNEENMIHELQKYITAYIGRYLNPNYVQTHNLYYVKFIMNLYTFMALWIYNIRLKNVRSPWGYTHSHHLRNYIDRFGNLGWTVDHINKKEALWLYRNANWLAANSGKQMTFNSIVNNILTPSNIPLSRHTIKHDLRPIKEFESLTAKPFIERSTVNISHVGQASGYREITEVLEAEHNLAVENHYDVDGRAEKLAEESRSSMFDNLKTKVLESTVIDLSQLKEVTVEDIALNLWVFTATRRTYTGTVLVTNPITNERMQLTPLNAYVLAIYCFNKGYADYQLDKIPKFNARLIPRSNEVDIRQDLPTVPTLDNLKEGTSKARITEDELLDVIGFFKPQYYHRSYQTFSSEVSRQHTEYMRRYYSYCHIEDLMGHSMGEWAAHQMYWHEIPCSHNLEGMGYQEWLINHGIELDGFTREDYVRFAQMLVIAATGLDALGLEKLQRRQEAVLSILKHFMSYTVQLIQTVVSRDSFRIGFSFLRLGETTGVGSSEFKVELSRVVPGLSVSIISDTTYLMLLDITEHMRMWSSVISGGKIEGYSLKLEDKHKQSDRILLPHLSLFNLYAPEIEYDSCAIIEETGEDIVGERGRNVIVVENCIDSLPNGALDEQVAMNGEPFNNNLG